MSHPVPYVTSDDAFMAPEASGYWADVQLLYVNPRVPVLDLVVQAVIVTVTEPSEVVGRKYRLTVNDLDAAARRALDESLLGPTYAGYIASRDLDGPSLDSLIQIAAFDGRLIFG